ncbi:MAG TPA: EF-Tu/IF-2/RF-3 family GTPase [Coriobacteriia bacterium]
MAEQLVGHVTHWFGHVNVAGIQIEQGELHTGDKIHIVGHTTDLEQAVGSMEIEHRRIEEAHAGEDIGVRVADPVREHDSVYKVLN